MRIKIGFKRMFASIFCNTLAYWDLISCVWQVEDYKHIEADEMKKVQEAVLAAQTWLNTQMQAVSKQPKYATPAVKAWEIRSEKKVLINYYYYYY